MVEIDWKPSDKKLRQFGVIALVGFGVLALFAHQEWLLFSGGLGEARITVAAALAGVGVLSLVIGLVFPKGNKPLFLLLTLVSLPIGFVMSYVILSTLFFLVIAPVGLLLRLTGRDPMERGFRRDLQTHWVDASRARPKESYFRQF